MMVGLVEEFTSMKYWYVLNAIFLCVIAASSTHVNAQSPAIQNLAIQDGDTVVFYGDSITALHLYTRFVEEFAFTRYPTLRVRFVNAGVSGDATYGGYAGTMQQRVQRDVTAFHPAMITVMLGMNDGGYVTMTLQIDSAFRKGYNDLLDTLTRENPKAALTLILPTPYDEITHGTEFPGYSRTIDTIADDVAELAAQRKAHSEAPAGRRFEPCNERFPGSRPIVDSRPNPSWPRCLMDHGRRREGNRCGPHKNIWSAKDAHRVTRDSARRGVAAPTRSK
jgi:lysophospholipase L1-like esterase